MERLGKLLSENRGELTALSSYALVSALLALAVPIAVQALVNSVAASVVQPLLILSVVALIGTGFVGLLAVLQLSLVERLQQRLLAKLALRMARRLIESSAEAWEGRYGPELANRFFDVLTIQKTLAKILLDGLAAAVSAAIGMLLLALYDSSGLLAGFDALLLIVIAFFVFPLGIGGLRTSITESTAKYRLAGWLEELARCQGSFKLHAAPGFLMRRAEGAVAKWLEARRVHFKVTLRQEVGNQLFQALASVGILAIGGYLVVRQQLTLGQLVAAQLIVAQVLKATEKLLRQAEQFYDLLTGLDKTGYLLDLEPERSGGNPLPLPPADGASVRIQDVRFAYPDGTEVLRGVSLKLEPGERVSLVGESGAGKSTLVALLCGLYDPQHGVIEINGRDLRSVDRSSLRQQVTIVDAANAIFEGTVEENIVLGRSYLTPEDINWALRIAQLYDDISQLPQGLETRLVTGGGNLSLGQIQRLLIARAIVDKPSLLILDEAFAALDESTAQDILDGLFDPENRWTIIDISHEGSVVRRTAMVHVLRAGQIVESGAPEKLAERPGGAFRQLFPRLCQGLREGSL
jgi:ABC-type bacteriocin/lantibiotic exporter with double-glycine peptidase domain